MYKKPETARTSGMWSRLIRMVAGAAAAMMLMCGTAQAAPTWIGVGSFGASQQSEPDVASNARGDTVAVWAGRSGANWVVQAAYRPAGGAVAFQTLTGSASPAMDPPQVGIDGAGNAIVTWSDTNAVYTAYRPFGGAFGSRIIFAANVAREPDVGVLPNGTAIFSYVRKRASDNCFRARSVPRVPGPPQPGGTEFGTSQDLSSCEAANFNAADPVIAMNAAGAAIVAYRKWDGAWRPAAVTKPAQAGFQNPRIFPMLIDPMDRLAVAVDPQGRATVLYSRTSGVIEARSRPVTESNFDNGQAVRLSGPTVFRPDIATDSAGGAVAVWCDAGGNIGAAARAPGASGWSPVSGPGSCTPTADDPVTTDRGGVLDVAFSPANQAFLAFERSNGSVGVGVRGSGSFGSAQTISPGTTNAFGPHIAFDAQGNATAAWARDAGQAQLAAFDAGPPSITAFNGPGVVTAGQDAGGWFAAAFDIWTGASLRWSWGDGGVADGPAPVHRYAAPGTYTVTVVATDGVANASSAQRTVQVVPPDRDGDTFREGQDCDDFNANIRPGALEIKGNRVDENCDNVKEPFDANRARSTAGWSVLPKRLTLLQLDLTRAIRGTRVQVRCRGKRCPFSKTKTRRVRKAKTNLLKFLKIKPRKRVFRPRQKLEVWMRTPGYLGKVTRYKLKGGKIPSGRDLCLAPGARKPVKRCKPPA